ncbi:cytochrome P450 71A8-like [Salvia miltiorrhiza]|uniref:cytochrome P450 71A8-like n=1 Tax=Salvia miltiorrhiza TaxID=226208 RepID=UPI0025ABE581|nr:cytochrome P450 71A8-like [Salvia miltiorrhiza]XP_057787926.1 cytochrome P450 71A8-like [Salvia miltiorrhiza]
MSNTPSSSHTSTMEELQLNPFILTTLLSLIILWSINIVFLKPRTKLKVPPSPPKLPIIGNLHQLGSSLPHRDLHSLAKKHGPLMLLHLGSVPVLIVSSAEFACEIMKTHDILFANRPGFKAMKKLFYDCRDVAFSPYGEYWRHMKSIVVLQLLSNKRVQSFSTIREEETALLVRKIRESSGPVDLSAMFARFSNDGIGRSAFGGKLSDSENGKKFLHAMTELMELSGIIDISDYIPWLGWIGRLNGIDKRLDNTAKEMDQVLESVIQERLQIQEEKGVKQNGQDFLDILLGIYNDKTVDASIDRDSIKALLLNSFVGGTDTISTTMEWTMSELLLHPTVMEKLQHEVRGIVKPKQEITDDDVQEMHYLKAVIKEALRFHPPLPLLVPRRASKDVQVKGFDICAGTVVMINAWAIGRDPVSWDEPEKFMPERFLNSSLDFKGLDFELIPFGAGRRGCPGISFSIVAMELLLANLVQKFDWKLPQPKDLDMTESPGMTAHRVVPLRAVASCVM